MVVASDMRNAVLCSFVSVAAASLVECNVLKFVLNAASSGAHRDFFQSYKTQHSLTKKVACLVSAPGIWLQNLPLLYTQKVSPAPGVSVGYRWHRGLHQD